MQRLQRRLINASSTIYSTVTLQFTSSETVPYQGSIDSTNAATSVDITLTNTPTSPLAAAAPSSSVVNTASTTNTLSAQSTVTLAKHLGEQYSSMNSTTSVNRTTDLGWIAERRPRHRPLSCRWRECLFVLHLMEPCPPLRDCRQSSQSSGLGLLPEPHAALHKFKG